VSQASRPAFSVVVPTRDRPERLAQCLEAIAALHAPREGFEVIVVDDGGTKSLASVIAPVRETLRLTFVRQRNRGPAGARNAGAAQASGPVLVFTDDDCEPEPNWLVALEAALVTRAGSMVGGKIVNGLEDDLCARASQRLISYLYDYYGAAHPSRFFCSNNLAVPADRFRALGGFETSFRRPAAEDRDFCDRWLRRGYPMHYEPRAVVRHFHAMRLGGFLRQHFRYGEGAFQLSQLRRRRGSGPLRIEPTPFYTGLLRSPFDTSERRWRLGIAVLLAASQLAGAAGFFWAKSRAASARAPTGRRREK